MSKVSSEHSSLGPLAKGASLAILCAAVCFLPYLYPVAPTVSRSYVAGFSNRAAVLILIVGSLIFAVLTRGLFVARGEKDSQLTTKALVAGWGTGLLVCLLRLKLASHGFLGGESYYFLNRQQMLAAGLAPYRQFEFVYGPALLYPNVWLTGLLHCTALHGYAAIWFCHWLVGIAMLWFIVRAIDIEIPNRTLLFVFLLLCQLIWTDFGGLNYTPFRAYAAAFCIMASHSIWARTRNFWILYASTVLSIVIALAVSVEQGISAAIGMLGFMMLLTLSKDRKKRAFILCLTAVTAVACLLFALRYGLMISFLGFASGGYSYPLLPSFSILIALIAYISSACVLYRTVLKGDVESSNVPLVLAGCALLPVALGRCDLLHISGATPAFAIGMASLFAAPHFRRPWVILAFLGLVIVPFGLRRGDRFWKFIPSRHTFGTVPPPAIISRESFVANQFYVSDVELTATDLPCDELYFAPSFMVVPTKVDRLDCLDTGYYQGLVDVITPVRISDKIAEMQRRPAVPLILENAPLSAQFPTELSDLESLRRDSGSFWVPAARHPPVQYSPIADYIADHYTPGPTFADDKMRIWYAHP